MAPDKIYPHSSSEAVGIALDVRQKAEKLKHEASSLSRLEFWPFSF